LFYLDNLTINNFRNYSNQQLEFYPNLNVIIGDNAQGKTNLIESIYYISVTRSFRTKRDYELIKWNEPFFFLKGRFTRDNLYYDIQVSYEKASQLKILINKNQINRYDHLQRFPVVAFSPDDLLIIREGPAIRRRFINLFASRLSLRYFQDLKDYQRVLMQRNFILKEKRRDSNIRGLLEPWNQALISLGSSIVLFRSELTKQLAAEVRTFSDNMTSSHERLRLEYRSTISGAENLADIENDFRYKLPELFDQEIRRGATLIGPHLDDLKIYINDFDTRHYSSQGQKRTAALALRIGEVNLFRRQCGFAPIILLDDVFSEFDSARQEFLFLFLKKYDGQSFITTSADINFLTEKVSKDLKKIYIQHGSVVDEKSRAFD
jgi:DNA replication and repair protein RecF